LQSTKRTGESTYGKILYSDIDESVIYDIVDYPSPVLLSRFSELLGAKTLCGSLSQSIFGYTVVNSLNALPRTSSTGSTGGARNGR